MVSLIVTDAKHKPLRAVDDYMLDLAYGSDENSFKLTCLPQPEAGALIIIDGTEYGGLVTVRNTDGSMEGPTWHGLLSRRILQPDRGQDYLTVSGAAGDVLNMLFKRIGLDALFTASARHAVTINPYSFDRYTDAYTGIRKMLAANNAKLRLIWADGRVNAYALPAEHYGDSIDSDLVEFKASLDSQPVNHLIGLGTGELKDRAVVHWYADVNGNVSQTQSLTGLAERQAVYDYSNARPDELNTETRKKLIELQSQGGVEVTITDNTLSMDVGDTVTGRDNRLGITLTVPVAKKIVKSSGGILSVDYECGTASGDTTSLSGSAESNGSTGSGGSGAYYADGVTITMRNNTFSAVVTPFARGRRGENSQGRLHARLELFGRNRQGTAGRRRRHRRSSHERGLDNHGHAIVREQERPDRAHHGNGGHGRRIRTHERGGQAETRRIGELRASGRHHCHVGWSQT